MTATTKASKTELAKLKKFVLTTEIKIEDLEQEIAGCTDRKELKTLQASLKKLKADPKYDQAQKDIVEMDAELRRLALHEAAASPTGKAGLVASNAPKREAASASTPEELMALIEKAQKAGAKDLDAARDLRTSALKFEVAELMKLPIGQKIDEGLASKEVDVKVGTMRVMKALSFLSPVVILRAEALIPNLGDKMSKHAVEAFQGVVKDAPGQVLPSVVLPAILKQMSNKKWKVKAAAMECLATVIECMATAPRQLAATLHDVIPLMVDASKEIRQEIRTAAENVLRSIGNSVGNPEIKACSEDVIKALTDPANQKLSQEVLMKIGSTTFMNYVDANGLAILAPILVRALREREQKSRKWASQILGSCIKLVKDIDFVVPYLDDFLPLLKNALVDETPEVQREAAKAFGHFAHGLPELFKSDLRPYLKELCASKEENERYGAALALSYIYFGFGKDHVAPILEECYEGVMGDNAQMRHAYFEILDILPSLLKEDFAVHIEKSLFFILKGNSDSDDHARAASVKAASSLIGYFAPMVPQLLFPLLQDVYLKTETVEDRLVIIQHVVLLASKILDNKKYGQDLLTTECGPEETRKQIASFLFLVQKCDTDGNCIRAAAQIWKTAGGSSKMLQACLDTYAALFAAFKKHGEKHLVDMISKTEEALVDNKVFESAQELEDKIAAKADEPVELFKIISTEVRRKKLADESSSDSEDGHDSHNVKELVQKAKEVYDKSINKFGVPMSEAQAKYTEAVLTGCLVEVLKKNAFAGKVSALLKDVFPELAAKNELLVEIFSEMHPYYVEDALDDGGEELIRVDNMMLMYGGGHLLLKDTTLRICKGRKYGIVGHNGCGKTTLMKQLAAGNVSGMPAGLKVQHVSDAELGDMKVLEMEARAFIARDAPKGLDIDQTLEDVNFPRDIRTSWFPISPEVGACV